MNKIEALLNGKKAHKDNEMKNDRGEKARVRPKSMSV